MKNIKSFMLILISTALVGIMIFYYAMGVDAFAGIRRAVFNTDITPQVEQSIKYGYVNTNKNKVPIPNADTAINQYASDLLDSITEQVSGMTVKDMHKDLDKKLNMASGR